MEGQAKTQLDGRGVGTSESGWCRSVPGGTGVTAIGIHLSRPIPPSTIQKAIHQLQLSHPILRAKITNTSTRKNHYNFFFSIPQISTLTVQSYDASATAQVLERIHDRSDSVLHALIEHEMNPDPNPWKNQDPLSSVDVLYSSLYALPDGSGSTVLVLRVHVAAADRVCSVPIVRELLGLLGKSNGNEGVNNYEVLPSLEDLVPAKLKKKKTWARGVDMFGYSMNFSKSSILPFSDTKSSRSSRIVMLDLNADHTQKMLSMCKEKGIKLCGALTAAGLIAAVKSKGMSGKKSETYTTVTLIDRRKHLSRVLTNKDIGSYQTTLQNIYTMNGKEELWELSAKCYNSMLKGWNYKKDLTDIADLNFLMLKAIENPGMTQSSSMRTALMSVFMEPEVCSTEELSQGVSIEDYISCTSCHGVGTSVSVIDAIKDGKLSCACIYASPLYSREKMQEFVDEMKSVLVGGITTTEED